MKKRQFVHSFALLIILVVAIAILFSYSNLKFTGLIVLNDYENQTSCEGAGNYWYEEDCYDAQPVCAADFLELCDETNCGSAGGYWYNNECNEEEETCTETWVCGEWGTCTAGSQTRTCSDTAGCNSTVNTESQACTVCGNGIVETGETCESNDTSTACTINGYTGIQNCGSSCNWDTCVANQSCGDGIINGNEECEGSNLGTNTCESEGFDAGTLTCASDCTLNENGCTTQSSSTESGGDEDDDGADEVIRSTTIISTNAVQEEKTKDSCTPNWECGEWQECIDETQIRICTDLNQCNPEELASTESQACVVKIKETCSDGIKNQNETGIDCGGICEKKCSFLTMVGSAITGPINVGKEFVLKNMFSNITRTAISVGVLVVFAGGIAIGAFFLRKRRNIKKLDKIIDNLDNSK